MNPILVVDDEMDLVNLVRYNLQKEGYEVLCAYEGSSVLDLVWEKQPSLIILDLSLPDTDGRNFLMHLRERAGTSGVPVIVLSGADDPHVRAACEALGIELRATKDNLKAVVKMLRHVVDATLRTEPPGK